jgi:uncharacterized protein YdeI (BOF family)
MRNKIFLWLFLLFILSFVIWPNNVLAISYSDVNLSELAELELDTPVRVKGIVAVEPATLWKTIFYIVAEEGQSGVQIYMYKQDWPELALGDLIQVRGVLSESGGERRIKVKEKQDFQILDHLSPPQAQKISISQINKERIGTLAEIKGQLIEKKGDSFYVDDGTGEIRVVIKPEVNIDKAQFNEGDWLSLTGLISQTSKGYRLLPRFPEDLKLESSGQSSRISSVQQLDIPPRAQGRNLVKYLTAAAIGLTAGLVGLARRWRVSIKLTFKK